MTLLLEREEMPIELELIGIATNLWWEIVAGIILYSNKLYLNMVIREQIYERKKGHWNGYGSLYKILYIQVTPISVQSNELICPVCLSLFSFWRYAALSRILNYSDGYSIF